MRRPFRKSYSECTHTHTKFFVWGCAGAYCGTCDGVSSCGFRCATLQNRSDAPLHGTIVPTIHSDPLTCTAESQAIHDGAQINCALSIIRLLHEAFLYRTLFIFIRLVSFFGIFIFYIACMIFVKVDPSKTGTDLIYVAT